MSPRRPVQFLHDAYLDIVSGAGGLVDCRRLFVGDNQRKLVRAFSEVVELLDQSGRNPGATESLRNSAEVNQFYEVLPGESGTSVRLRDSVFRQAGPQFELDPQVEIHWRGRAFTRRLPAAEFGALGLLLPLLSGKRAEEEVISALNQHGGLKAECARELLEWLRACNLLEDVPEERLPYPRPAAGARMTFLGHTSLLFQTSSAAVVLDPFFRPDAGHFIAARRAAGIPLDAISLSHSHWDHCNMQTLLWFDKSIPVLIPRVERPSAFNPPIEPMLRAIGFGDVREATPWSPVRFGGIEIIPTPFHGEQDEPGAEIDHYTYVVRSGEAALYGGVDCFRDTFGEMEPVLERIHNEFHPQVAALPVSRMVFHYRHGGVNSFCREMSAERLDSAYQYTAGPEDAALWAKTLGARWVFGYATFVFGSCSVPAVLHQFRLALRNMGIERTLLPLRPFDSIDLPAQTGALSFRRRLLLAWLRLADLWSRTDKRLHGFALYRGVRRMVRRFLPANSNHHH